MKRDWQQGKGKLLKNEEISPYSYDIGAMSTYGLNITQRNRNLGCLACSFSWGIIIPFVFFGCAVLVVKMGGDRL